MAKWTTEEIDSAFHKFQAAALKGAQTQDCEARRHMSASGDQAELTFPATE